jgi:hypothetical protein
MATGQRLDFRAIAIFVALAVAAYLLFANAGGKIPAFGRAAGAGASPSWGPMAGSGPGIRPAVQERECRHHAQRADRAPRDQSAEVAAFNPSALSFASVDF